MLELAGERVVKAWQATVGLPLPSSSIHSLLLLMPDAAEVVMGGHSFVIPHISILFVYHFLRHELIFGL